MKKMFILLFTLIILAGCSNNESEVIKKVTYTGEADSWKTTIVNVISEDSDDVDYTMSIEYKGDLADLKNIHQIKYSYEYGLTEISRSEDKSDGFNSKDTKAAIVYEDKEQIKKYLIDEQTNIPFKIEWNNNVEEFELKLSK